MKKTLYRLTGLLAATLLASTLACGMLSCDNSSSDKDDGPTYSGGTGGDSSAYSDGSTGTTKESVIMDEAWSVAVVLRRDCKADDSSVLKSFRPSSAAPSDGVTTYKLSAWDSSVDVLAWLDGATIWYYAAGYTDSGKKIPLPEPVSYSSYSVGSIFRGCYALKSIDMSGFDTSKATSMSYLFEDCTKLTDLDLSKLDSSSVTSMDYMFSGCTSLTSLDLSRLNTSSVTSMSSMFSGCTGLSSLDLSSLNTSKVTNMYCLFEGCSNLTSLNLSNLNTSKVTNMACMFEGCSNLTSLNVSNFDTSKVTYIYSMFSGCIGLSSLDVSSFDTGNVTSMFAMFDDCTGLQTIYASDRFVTDKVESGSYSKVFNGCTNLVGGQGTAYSSSNANDHTFARIDGGAANPGYFTAKP